MKYLQMWVSATTILSYWLVTDPNTIVYGLWLTIIAEVQWTLLFIKMKTYALLGSTLFFVSISAYRLLEIYL